MCFKGISKSSLVDRLLTLKYVNTLHHTFIQNCLPEDEPVSSKHVEDIIKLKIKILV